MTKEKEKEKESKLVCDECMKEKGIEMFSFNNIIVMMYLMAVMNKRLKELEKIIRKECKNEI